MDQFELKRCQKKRKVMNYKIFLQITKFALAVKNITRKMPDFPLKYVSEHSLNG